MQDKQPATQSVPKPIQDADHNQTDKQIKTRFFSKIFKIRKKKQTESQTNTQSGSNKRRFRLWPQKKWKQFLVILSLFLLVILASLATLGIYTYQVVQDLQAQGMNLKTQLQGSYDQFKQQNLPQAEAGFTSAQEKFNQLRSTYSRLSFYNKLPIAKKYYRDGEAGLNAADHGLKAGIISLQAIAPYADVLGFEGEGSFSGGTAEDRINLMLQTLDKITPQLDEIQNHLAAVQTELGKINPQDYPESLQDTSIRPKIIQAKDMVNQGVSMLTDFRPVIEQLPSIAGGKGERKKYLVLFQNDNELRPTGGFLTAYSVIYIENGKVTPEKSDDIYELDQKFNQRIEIPEELGRYLTTEKYWNLRDMNTSPDFKVSMDTFYKHYQTVPGEPENIDGIIAVDTHVLTGLLAILGPTEVPGYGTFSAQDDPRCDCPQVVYALSEIITKPTPYMREDRKGILGPMMQAILLKTYSAPKQQWPQLFELAWDSMKGRHLQMYFQDEQAQLAAENVKAAGRQLPIENSDFLAIVDANLGGAKSNLFTNYKVEQLITGPENGQLTKTVTITYRNTRKADNCNLEAGQLCLNSTLPDWHRLYLPANSQLIKAQGFTQEPKQYQERGFSVLDGFFKLEPNGQAKVKVEYTVPYTQPDYHLYIWKQGGVSPFDSLIDVNGNQTKVTVDQDITYTDQF